MVPSKGRTLLGPFLAKLRASGEELQLRDLQRSGRIGHVDVSLNQRKGSVNGEITLTTSMDQVSTSVIGASLETIDRIGPCKASIRVQRIENVVSAKRDVVIDRAKRLLMDLIGSGADESKNILDEVRSVLTVDTEVNVSGMTAGPNVKKSDGIIIVEGRNDVRNLLKYGIKNAIAMMGSGVSDELSNWHPPRKTSRRSSTGTVEVPLLMELGIARKIPDPCCICTKEP